MDKEITKMLELLRKGMEQLPEMGSKGWEMYVRGYQIDHMIKATVVGVILLLSAATLFFCFKRVNKITNSNSWYAEEDAFLYQVVAAITAVLVFPCTLLGFYFCLRGAIVPEYSLITELIRNLGQ